MCLAKSRCGVLADKDFGDGGLVEGLMASSISLHFLSNNFISYRPGPPDAARLYENSSKCKMKQTSHDPLVAVP
jgi:hypothetical protein